MIVCTLIALLRSFHADIGKTVAVKMCIVTQSVGQACDWCMFSSISSYFYEPLRAQA